MLSLDKKSNPMDPYIAGALAGALAILSVAIAGKFLGASTTFARLGGAVEGMVSPEHVSGLSYFQKYVFKVDWQLLFVIGIALGAFISSVFSGTFRLQAVPDMWKARFGPSIGKRTIVAFIGGIFAAFGARMAGGCPSGHGLSGLMQLSLSGFVSLACFFLGGMIVARLLYGRRSAR